jgi:hypothetical protein
MKAALFSGWGRGMHGGGALPAGARGMDEGSSDFEEIVAHGDGP